MFADSNWDVLLTLIGMFLANHLGALAVIQRQWPLNIFIPLKRKFVPISCHFSIASQLPNFKPSTIYFLYSGHSLFWIVHINRIIQYVIFCNWLLLLSIFSRSAILWYIFLLLFFFNWQIKFHSVVYYIYLSTHQLIDILIVSNF